MEEYIHLGDSRDVLEFVILYFFVHPAADFEWFVSSLI